MAAKKAKACPLEISAIIGKVQQGQRLPLGLEAGNDVLGVHPRLDHLQGHAPLDRLLLLGQIDHAAAAFAENAQYLVGAAKRSRSTGPPWRRYDSWANQILPAARRDPTSRPWAVPRSARRVRGASQSFERGLTLRITLYRSMTALILFGNVGTVLSATTTSSITTLRTHRVARSM